MVIKTRYRAPISVLFLIIVTTIMLISSATSQLRSSSAYNFDPDYPVGTPPIKGGTGYVTEVTDGDGWHTDGGAIGFGQKCTDAAACKNAGVYGLYHPGEDWNCERGTVGQPVYAIAYGTVFDTRAALFGDKSGYGSGIVIEHTLPSGEKIYSVYEHINTSLNKGDPVYQGQSIGSVADTTKLTPHLHFEIRTTLNKADWYPNDEGRGYYSSEEKIYTNGFIDPSVFLDFHRGSLPLAVAAMMVGFPGFGIPGFGLPSTDTTVAVLKTGIPGFGTPLLSPPTSGMSSDASNYGPFSSGIGKPLITRQGTSTSQTVSPNDPGAIDNNVNVTIAGRDP